MLSCISEILKSRSKIEHQRIAMDSSRDEERKPFLLHLHGYIYSVSPVYLKYIGVYFGILLEREQQLQEGANANPGGTSVLNV